MEHDDRRAIRDLIYDYAHHLDTGDVAAVAALFAEARMEVRHEGRIVGSTNGGAELQALLAAAHVDHGGTPGTHHVTTNVRVDVEGDTASAVSSVTLFQAAPDFPLQAVSCGTYRDRFRKVDGRWGFTERVSEARLVGDLSRRLRPADVPGGTGELARLAAEPGPSH